MIVILAALMITALGTPACFSPRQPACAFSCEKPPHTCPSDYVCGDDGFCHRDGVPADGTCDQPEGDGASDTATADGAVNNND